MICQRLLKPFICGPVSQVRFMAKYKYPEGHTGSMWPTEFEEPILHKNDIKNAKVSGEFRKKSLVPVKAADPRATCSNFLEKEYIDFLRLFLKDGKSHIGVEVLNKTYALIKETQLKKYYKATPERREHIITDPTEILKRAVENARPLMSIMKIQKGGQFYQVPGPITMKRSLFESRRWILNAVRPRISSRDTAATRIHEVLAHLLIETSQNQGRVIAQRNEHHKTCEQNRAYAHFR